MATVISKLDLDVTNKKIIISATAETGGYINDIRIDTQRSFVCTSEPSSNASIITIDTTASGVELNGENKIISITNYEINLASATSGALLTLDINNDMMFVYVYGNPDISAGVTFDQNSLYQLVFRNLNRNLISQKCCTIDQSSVDLVLLFEAFQLSWSTADPRKFIYYWNRLHNYSSDSSSNCGCNG